MDRMFLVEKGRFVVIRDGIKEISFLSFEEFYEYYNLIDLTGKWYIDYEPERNLYIDSVTNPEEYIVVSEYEAVINSIDDLIAKKEDPYFSKTINEAKDIKKESIKYIYLNKLGQGYELLNYRFDCAGIDRSNIVNSFTKMQISNELSISFYDYYNIPRILSFEDMKQLSVGVVSHYESLIKIKNQYYEDIENKTTIEEVKSVNWV